MMEQPNLGPVRESERILSLDATRGFALLGIFLVNINAFGEAFGHFMMPVPRDDRGGYEWLMWVLGKTFWEGRFYPLFSMLFGMGLVLQWQRAKASGRSFTPTAARRLIVLAIIGALHALLLWFGDILFIYGIVGLLMLALIGLSARVLFIIAGSIVAFMVTMSIGFGMLGIAFGGAAGPNANAATIAATAPDESREALSEQEVHDTVTAVDSTESPFRQLWSELWGGKIADGPGAPRWMELEERAYREGPWLDSFGFRAMTWAGMLAIALVFLGWDVLAMFCLGAALMKCGIFQRERRRWHVIFVALAALVALPLSLANAIAMPTAGLLFHTVVGTPTLLIAGPMMSLGYLGAITLLVHAGLACRCTSVLAAAGRMAFTNYLMQTVIATTIFYHWGFALFGSTTRLERVGMVLAIYAFQLAFSVVWLKYFTMGPLEWLWRAATYMKFTPLRRPRAAAA